jgi:hypothetical protein
MPQSYTLNKIVKIKMANRQMNLGSVIIWFIQILYNIIQFSLPDIISLLQNHTTFMLIIVVGANGFLAILQVLFHIDPKEIDTYIQGIRNLAKENSKKDSLSDADLTQIETEGMYWIKKLIAYLTNIRKAKEDKTPKDDKNGQK